MNTIHRRPGSFDSVSKVPAPGGIYDCRKKPSDEELLLDVELLTIQAELFTRAWVESEGKLTIMNIAEWGECSQHQARKMQSTWALRGWITKDGNRDNSFCLTAKALQLVANHQTQQTSSNRRQPAQTQ